MNRRPLKKLGSAYAHEGMAPLAGCTPEGTRRARPSRTPHDGVLLPKAAELASRPILSSLTSDDGLAPGSEAFADALKKAGNERVKTLHFSTDHSYSDRRIALSDALIEWLGTLPSQAHPRQ